MGMVRKFPGIISRKSENRWISEMRTIQPKVLKIPGAKLNGKKTFCKTFSKIWVYHSRLSCFWKFFKVLFHSLLDVADNSNSTFWLNGKRPCWIMQLNLLFLCKISSSKFSKGSLSCSVKRLKSSIVSERETFPPPPSVGVASVLVLVVETFMLLV